MLTHSCAAELRLQRALDRRYRWPSRVAGFEATARYRGGEAGWGATVRVSVTGPACEVGPGRGDPRVVRAIGEPIDALRRPSVLDLCLPWPKQSSTLKAGRGELIRVDDPSRTTLRITGGELAEVHRDLGRHRVAWRIDQWRAALDGRVLPASMLVTFDDRATGAVSWFERVNDDYEDLGGVLVPVRRRVVRWADHRRTTSDLQLLFPTLLERSVEADRAPLASAARPERAHL